MTSPSEPDDGRRDFDFEFGSWRVHHRKLVSPLRPAEGWEEFESDVEVRPVLMGLGNVELVAASPPNGPAWEAVTLRIFDPATRLWSIHWSSTQRPGRLDPPVVGRFENGIGEFTGDDVLAGRPIRVRFWWKEITASSAVWEQAFSVDAGATWERNWVMTFRRTASA